MGGELVLVTGGSGFIGAHCIIQLLDAGYRVRTTLRSLNKEAVVRAMLKTGGATNGERAFLRRYRPHVRCGLAGGCRRVRFCAACRLALSSRRA